MFGSVFYVWVNARTYTRKILSKQFFGVLL